VNARDRQRFLDEHVLHQHSIARDGHDPPRTTVDKKALSKRDICTKFISPAIGQAGWDKPNIPLAIIEAKDNNHAIGAGMQQALEYGEMIDVPFVFSSNGDG
jgi:type I site-specific restriction endonuclease